MGFGDFDDIFGRVDRMMNGVMRSMLGSMPDPYDMLNDMNQTMRQFERYQHQPTYQSYSMHSSPLSSYSTTHYSSSYMSTSNGMYGPQIYEATQSSRYAPGGVQETRSTVRDSRTGLHQMSIGHHINDRAHIMQRSRNYYTGAEEHNDEYVNLEEEEGQNFDREWQRRAYGAAGYRSDGRLALAHQQQSEAPRILALPPCEPAAPRAVSPPIVLDDAEDAPIASTSNDVTNHTTTNRSSSRHERGSRKSSKSRRDKTKPYHKH